MRSVLSGLMTRVWAVREGPTSLVDKWLARDDLIAAWNFEKKGNPSFDEQAYFTDDDSAFLRLSCDWSLAAGFGLDASMVRDIMASVLSEQDGADAHSIGLRYVRKWMRNNGLSGFATSGIDKQRAMKATNEVHATRRLLLPVLALFSLHDASDGANGRAASQPGSMDQRRSQRRASRPQPSE